jgi:hypothetical protein
VKAKFAAVLVEDGDSEDVCRQQITGELDTIELKAHGASQGIGQGCLAHAGKVLDEQMSTGEQAAQGEANLVILAQQGLADLSHRTLNLLREGAVCSGCCCLLIGIN